MIKHFKLEITNPCEQDFNQMETNEKGFFCQSCAKTVIDFSNKSNYEIGKIISESQNNTNLCARLYSHQLEQNYSYSIPNHKPNRKYAVAVAATVLMSTGIAAQENPVTEIIETKPAVTSMQTGKIIVAKDQLQTITIIGQLIDASTNKPFSEKIYPNIIFAVSGSYKNVNVHPKTGRFVTTTSIDKSNPEVEIYFQSGNFEYNGTIELDLKKIKKNKWKHKFVVDFNQKREIQTAGGISVKYVEEPSNCEKK
jgi:hypothetical protein